MTPLVVRLDLTRRTPVALPDLRAAVGDHSDVSPKDGSFDKLKGTVRVRTRARGTCANATVSVLPLGRRHVRRR